jgi:CDP-glucose 4,6-dehydratase
MVRQLEVYRGKKVFVTGHTGFKGSWLVKLLSMAGADILGYSLKPNTEPNLFSVLGIENLCKSIIGDIRDKENLEKYILEFKPDFIFHLAAQPIVLSSYEEPSYTFEVNVIGTANVLEAVKKLNKPNVNTIVITTDKVYENIEKDYAYKETDRLGGYDPYSASKAAAEIVVSSFRSSFFNPKDFSKHKNKIVSVRAGNVIGGGDWAKDRLVPDIARAINNDETIIIRNPNSIRPWQHVLEPLWGYLFIGILMGENKLMEGAINFGPYSDDTLKVEDMVKLAIEILGKGKYNCPCLDNKPHEANLLKLNIEKAIYLGWKPRWNAKEALKESLEWYKNYYQNPNQINDFTIKQIEEYFNI